MYIVKKIKSNGICIISLNGNVNIKNKNDYEREINDIINESSKKIIFDLENVGYINSIELDLLAYTIKKLKRIKGSIKFINASKSLLELFELTRLSKVLKICENEEIAIKKISDEELEN